MYTRVGPVAADPEGEEAAGLAEEVDSAAVAAASGTTAPPDTDTPAGISTPISAAMIARIVMRAMQSAKNAIAVTGATVTAFATPTHTATTMMIVMTTAGTASTTLITGAAIATRPQAEPQNALQA